MPSNGGLSEQALDSVRRRLRLIVLIKAGANAGFSPIPILRLHSLAYLTNVLAPVWNMPSFDGKVLKRRGGPFYPALQRDLDSLVGMGIAAISGLSHLQDEENRWRLEGAYALNDIFAERILKELDRFPEERALMGFIQELALALSALNDEDLDVASREDATYADPIIAMGEVLDFAEWNTRNLSAKVADELGRLIPSGVMARPSEKLHLYIRHLYARMHGKQIA
jgi:hypothetical protein